MQLKSFIISFLAFCGIAISINAYSDTTTMSQPKPIENKVFDAMVGTWTGESNNMLGVKMREVFKIRWGLNHQFLLMDLNATAVNPPHTKYEGMGVMGVDAQGKAKTWWFDNWGADAASTGSGTFGDNMLTISDGNPMFSETRSFEIKGNEMIMKAKGTMKWQGKETPFDETTVFKKM